VSFWSPTDTGKLEIFVMTLEETRLLSIISRMFYILSLKLGIEYLLTKVWLMNVISEVIPHHQRIFVPLTPFAGAQSPGLCTIASSALGASRAPRRHRSGSLPHKCPNSSNSGRNWSDFSRNYGPRGALTPAF